MNETKGTKAVYAADTGSALSYDKDKNIVADTTKATHLYGVVGREYKSKPAEVPCMTATDDELIEELRSRGFKGTLTKTVEL